MGFDLVRNEYGGWRVLEDNLRSPSGAAYAIAVRGLMDAVLPELPRPPGLAHPAAAYELLRSTLLRPRRAGHPGGRCSPAARAAAPGSSTAASPRAPGWGWSSPTTSSSPTGGWCTATAAIPSASSTCASRASSSTSIDRDGRPIGQQLLDVAIDGRVVLANAPGNGIADDKSTYPLVPELITYYLGERPALESVPTYRTADEVERRGVLERVGELVTKPVDGFGGAGVLIGPAATAAEVARRRFEIAANPEGWVAQEVVSLSSLPCLDAGRMEPRRVDLRAFVYLTGPRREDCRLAPLAPDPRRPARQPDRQQLAGRRRQGHLDRDRTDGRRATDVRTGR